MTIPQNHRSIFDSIRDLVARGMQVAHSVHTADTDPETTVTDKAKDTPPTSSKHRTIGPQGIALIKRFEGCARLRTNGMVEAYPDPGTGGDPWTIGWGSTGQDQYSGGRIGPGTVWSQQQCDARLERDLVRYANDVDRALGDAPTSQQQFDALVSFHYNTGAIGRATLTRLHKAGEFAAAAGEFARWNKAGGRVLKGLIRRRAAEAALYLAQ